MNTIKINKYQTKMIAHRGLSGLERENTIKAFIAAANRDYYGSECDIHLTKDEVFVVCHDENIARVSGFEVAIAEISYQKLAQYNLYEFQSNKRSRDLFIPTLEEYLGVQLKYNKHCIIEIKGRFEEKHLKRLLNIVQGFPSLVTFISFNLQNLITLRAINENISLQYLTSQYTDNLIPLLKRYKLDVDIFYQELTKEIIDAFHKEKIIVNAWTINEKNVAEKLASYGIDYITTNILE